MACLSRLSLTGFRCFETVRFDFDPGLNIIQGANASGKTALLEALWLLATGRSFRTTHLQQLIRHGEEEAVVFAQVGVHRLGWARNGAHTRLHLDGESVRTQAALSAHLPLQLLTPESHRLLTDGPKRRRQFLDWGGFYHYGDFMAVWRSYRQALKQRNAALRQGLPTSLVRLWDGQLIDAGARLDAFRRDYVAALAGPLEQYVAELLPELKDGLSIHYHSGWRQSLSLAEALEAGWAQDQLRQQSRIGPHRADVRFRIHGREVEQVLSRGQQKLFVSALLLAQAQLFARARGEAVILLIDDLPAELDGTRRSRLLALVKNLEIQSLVTTTDLALIPGVEAAHTLRL